MISRVRPLRPRSAAPYSGFPRVFLPESAAAAASPVAWLEERFADVQAALRASGLVVLRGFQIDDPQIFRALATRAGGPLAESYEGPSPREALSRAVYTASEVPSALVIPEHAEMSSAIRPAEAKGIELVSELPEVPVWTSSEVKDCRIQAVGKTVSDEELRKVPGKW